MAPTLDLSRFYANKDYSDITVKFGERAVPCHKFILCERSEYFKTACGLDAKFKEGVNGVIELQDDDPDAVEAILRFIYTGGYRVADRWEDAVFHLNVSVAANKYFLDDLNITAHMNFLATAKAVTEVAKIVAIMDYLQTNFPHDENLLPFAEHLRKANLNKLVNDSAYRSRLDQNKDLLWKHFDELVQGSHMAEKRLMLCDRHANDVLSNTPSQGDCEMCASDGHYGYNMPQLANRSCWVKDA